MLFRFIPAPLPLLSMCVQPRPDGAVMRPGTKRALPSASAGPLPCPFARGECELKYVECLLQESTNGLLRTTLSTTPCGPRRASYATDKLKAKPSPSAV